MIHYTYTYIFITHHIKPSSIIQVLPSQPKPSIPPLHNLPSNLTHVTIYTHGSLAQLPGPLSLYPSYAAALVYTSIRIPPCGSRGASRSRASYKAISANGRSSSLSLSLSLSRLSRTYRTVIARLQRACAHSFAPRESIRTHAGIYMYIYTLHADYSW